MKLSTVRVSHIFNTGAIHETDLEGEIERLLGEYFDELAVKHCAAGPWRTDVENAPKGVLMVLLGGNLIDIWIHDEGVWTSSGGYVEPRQPFAFAVPNAPQVTI